MPTDCSLHKGSIIWVGLYAYRNQMEFPVTLHELEGSYLYVLLDMFLINRVSWATGP